MLSLSIIYNATKMDYIDLEKIAYDQISYLIVNCPGKDPDFTSLAILRAWSYGLDACKRITVNVYRI